MDPITDEIPGLVWAYRFDSAGHCAPLSGTFGEIAIPPSGFLWLHLSVTDIRLPGFLERLGLPKSVTTTLLQRELRSMLSSGEGYVYGVLPGFEADFEKSEEEPAPIGYFHLAVGKGIVITTRIRPLRSFSAIHGAIRNGIALERPASLFTAVMDAFHAEAVKMVASLTDEIDDIEDGVFDEKVHDERQRLGRIRRRLVSVHRNLRSATSLAESLDDDAIETLPEGMEAAANRVGQQLNILDLEVTSLQDRARLVQEEITTQLSWEMNRLLFVLSVISGLLLPPTLVTGFFGMNTPGLPFVSFAHGTLVALLIAIASGAFVGWLMIRAGMLHFGRRR
ncbi:Zinc transport protein ZntB [Hartmannibacter diazotrophicus]|uniref:Zinc transport protein ZntB n=1 Tax=Hartmannibacter diazotrophicus TaxID=1482074 RepID=A0A2C9D895_9HYPH|nr:CorA family divalent cation transporter [Hartmannibacter diazotrophicus]SON56542.1 Zinc transport protein ZntB [Hartmannibacter diazotrophicus]